LDFRFTDEQNMLRESVRKAMDKLATPEYIRRLDHDQAYPYALYDAWVDMGLLRMPFPEAYGGLDGNAIDMVIIAEELAKKSFDFFTAYGGSVFCGLNLVRSGTEERHKNVSLHVRAGRRIRCRGNAYYRHKGR
jgi:alkylation response protein AidB-like acyl-CoA dehydrogenase